MTIDREELRRLCESANPAGKYEDKSEFFVKARIVLPILIDALEEAESVLEIVRMQLAACGVIAMANTAEGAKDARDIHPDYDCASVRDVAAAVDREMTAREKLAAAEARERRLREALFMLCAWAEGAYAASPNITTYKPIGNARTALAETAP